MRIGARSAEINDRPPRICHFLFFIVCYNKYMQSYEIAVFGGGCFWCMEAIFKSIRGVASVMPGYAGGHTDSPSYAEVSSGKSGHVEVVCIEYDPAHISFKNLLTIFFATHDPTTRDRQGNDVGSQYRSVVFYMNDVQRREIEEMIANLNAESSEGRPIITEVRRFEKFYEAEHYHHNYYEKNKSQSYCQLVINPKLERLQKQFEEFLVRS